MFLIFLRDPHLQLPIFPIIHLYLTPEASFPLVLSRKASDMSMMHRLSAVIQVGFCSAG
jgi:hypothetical protein